MRADDVGRVPASCQGDQDTLLARIGDLGAAAILAFEGDRHVAQLQFRRHDPALRSADGIWSPDYWGDFGGRAPALPDRTLGIFCYHVGQLEDGEERDPRYQGRGIGLALLDRLLAWATSAGFEAIVAKHTPPDRAVMGFMGGQPATAYLDRGFEVPASWLDPQLAAAVAERGVVPAGSDPDAVSRVGLCVRHLRRPRARAVRSRA